MEDNTERNLKDLMNAANMKLQKQKEENEEEVQDIYADMRGDSQEADYPTDVNVFYRPQTPEYDTQDPYIDHDINNDTTPSFYMDATDVPIFEGGPGVAQVDVWKKQFTTEKVMHTQVLDRHFIFRTLNRFEYKQIVAIENMDALYREEVICRTCVLWPYDYDFKQMAGEDAGYPSTLAQIIMENSGFTKQYGIEVL